MIKKLLCFLFVCFNVLLAWCQAEQIYFSASVPVERIFKLDNILYFSTNTDIRYIDLNDPSFTPQILVDLNTPTAMEYKDGFLYIADWGALKVVKVNLDQANPTPVDVFSVTWKPNDLLFVGDVLYVSSNTNQRIYRYDINNSQTPEMFLNFLIGPLGLEYNNGFLYIAYSLANAIYRIDTISQNATPEVFIENNSDMSHPLNIEFMNDDLFIANAYSDNILKVNINNPPYTTQEILSLNGARDLLVDSESNMLYYCNAAFIYRLDLSSLSVQEENATQIKLYPNPTIDKITIANVHSQQSYIIIDILGQRAKQGILDYNGELDVSDLKTGSYFIKLENGTVLNFLKR